MSGITLPPGEKDPYKLAFAVRQLAEGRSNACGRVTLTASVNTTTVSAPNCAAGSSILLFPATGTAAGNAAYTYVKTTDVTAGQFIVTHPNDAYTDKTYYWVALG